MKPGEGLAQVVSKDETPGEGKNQKTLDKPGPLAYKKM